MLHDTISCWPLARPQAQRLAARREGRSSLLMLTEIFETNIRSILSSGRIYVYIYIYIYIYIHMYIDIYIYSIHIISYVYIYICVDAYVYTYVYIYMWIYCVYNVCMWISLSLSLSLYIYIHTYTYIYIYSVCAYTYIYIYIYTHNVYLGLPQRCARRGVGSIHKQRICNVRGLAQSDAYVSGGKSQVHRELSV